MNALRMMERCIPVSIILMISIVLMMKSPVFAAELSEQSDTGITEGVYGYTEVRAEVVVNKIPEKEPGDEPVSPDDDVEPEEKPDTEEEKSHPQTGDMYPVLLFMIILLLSAIIVVIMKICKCK